MSILYKNSEAFKSNKRYIVNSGGARSGKTFSILTLAYNIQLQNAGLFSIVSETFPHLRKGAIRDFKNIMTDANAWNFAKWNKTESIYQVTDKSSMEFFSCDSPGKVHGPARRFLFINEAQNISYEVFKQLAVRTTDTIWIDFNPTHEFWAHTELKNDPDCEWIHSTYLDNPYLKSSQIKEIEKGKSNPYWWQVYGLGEIGVLEGAVLTNWTECNEFPSVPSGLVYGIDFGFTNDPTACVRICFNGGKLWVDEVFYGTSLLNSDIIENLRGYNIGNTRIFADSAEPKTIQEIHNAGFDIHPATEAKKNINARLAKLQDYEIMITSKSENIIKELRNYTWAKDKTGNTLNKPIDSWNHGIDALGYSINDKLKREGSRAIILD